MAAMSTGRAASGTRTYLFGAQRDAHGLIADTFQVPVDLDHGEDEAQIDGHGLLLGEQIVGHLVDIALGQVDCRFIIPDEGAEPLIPLQVRVDGVLHGLLRERGHGEQLVLQLLELLMEVDAGHRENSLSHCA